jgi:Putative peptidoglycan binding domain
MRFIQKSVAIAAILLSVALPASASHARRGPTSHLFVKKHMRRGFRPVEGIAPDRAVEIQTALIKAGYLTGQPTGTWDATSEQAMQKMQSDNGWQTKITPDSRALIKLGLGPNSSETATTESTALAAQVAAN